VVVASVAPDLIRAAAVDVVVPAAAGEAVADPTRPLMTSRPSVPEIPSGPAVPLNPAAPRAIPPTRNIPIDMTTQAGINFLVNVSSPGTFT